MKNSKEYKLYRLFNYLKSIESYYKIKNDINLIKLSSMFPAGFDNSGNPSYGTKDISDKLIAKVDADAFTFFDFDLYVEDCIGNSAMENLSEYEESHESLDEFIGKCFYEDLVSKDLYRKLPGIIKDKSVIKKDDLIQKINDNIEILPEDMRDKFLKINEVIKNSKNPLFLFLYDTNQDLVDLTWKFVLHDIVHIMKDNRVEDIKDYNKFFSTKSGEDINLEEEFDERKEELVVANNVHYHDSYSSYHIFKRVIENPINKYIYDRFKFANLFKDIDKNIKSATNAVLRSEVRSKDTPAKEGPELYSLYKSLVPRDNAVTKARRDILFEIIKECLVNTLDKTKVDLLTEGDSPDRRTDLFAYYLFFGKITIDVNKIKSKNFRDFIFDKLKELYIPIIKNINDNFGPELYKYSDIIAIEKPYLNIFLANNPNELITDSDMESSIDNSIDYFMNDLDLIKNIIDNGLSEYENFAKGVESVYEEIHGDPTYSYRLRQDPRSPTLKDFKDYPSVKKPDKKLNREISWEGRDVDWDDPNMSKDEKDDHREKLSFLHSLIRSSNPFYDRMIQLTDSGSSDKRNPDDYVYAQIRI